MRYRQLGSSGLTVSAVGLGCPNFDGPAAAGANGSFGRLLDADGASELIHEALECGVTLFDLADLHADGGAERTVGALLRSHRDRVVIATKWGAPFKLQNPDVAWGSRRLVRRSAEASLRRLGTDYIDLYTYHWRDPKTPIEETLAALDELIREGKVRYIGHSHFSGWEAVDADWVARDRRTARFVAAQNHHNLLAREVENELLPACAAHGIGVLTYFPLGKGLLTGKYDRDHPPPDRLNLGGRVLRSQLTGGVWARIAALGRFAADHGHTLAELAIAYCAAQPAVASVLTGASRPAQVRQNAAAVEWALSPDELESVRRIASG